MRKVVMLTSQARGVILMLGAWLSSLAEVYHHMKTDIPLKSLTTLRGADLLPLIGLPFSELIKVETLEIPAMSR